MSNDKSFTAGSLAAQSNELAPLVMVYATFPSADAALQVGRRMVEGKMAGCVNVFPTMTSVYVWNGKTETSQEAVMIAKLPASAADAAVAFIKVNHSYETPAILVIPVIAGDASYLAWIAAGTQQT
jgi:periplasmic divalent cation tolerance protein